MRALLAIVAVPAAFLAAAPALGHPGHAPSTVDVGNFKFTPAEVTVAAGDDVIWFFAGPDTNHSATADEGQEERFDSDPSTAPALIRHEKDDGYAYTFTKLGTFTYHCKVHSSMTGKVIVKPPPPKDVTPPRLSRLSVDRVRPGQSARAVFTVSESSFVVASVRRSGSRRQLRSASAFVKAGRRSLRFSIRGLKKGLYRVVLTPEDDAGNRGASKSVAFRISS